MPSVPSCQPPRWVAKPLERGRRRSFLLIPAPRVGSESGPLLLPPRGVLK